jgi:hypothetical protein
LHYEIVDFVLLNMPLQEKTATEKGLLFRAAVPFNVRVHVAELARLSHVVKPSRPEAVLV